VNQSVRKELYTAVIVGYDFAAVSNFSLLFLQVATYT
jgi:hypothetical protein